MSLLIVALMFATLAVLVAGLILMARGGEANRKYGNKLMQYRILFQALAIGLFLAMVFFYYQTGQ